MNKNQWLAKLIQFHVYLSILQQLLYVETAEKIVSALMLNLIAIRFYQNDMTVRIIFGLVFEGNYAYKRVCFLSSCISLGYSYL